MQGGGHGKRIVLGITALAVAVLLKEFYSTASVDDLCWLLSPATRLVSVFTSETFTFEDHAGYVNGDGSFIIAAPCAGMNFLIAAFIMLTALGLWQQKEIRWTFLPQSLGVAYLTTIAANTVRIGAAIELHRMDPPMIWINPEELHRLEGIFVYFGFLLALFFIAESVRTEGRRAAIRWATWPLLPLSVYWITTLGVPFLNGARDKHARFLEHSLFVLITPPILILPLLTIWLVRRRRPAKYHSLYQ